MLTERLGSLSRLPMHMPGHKRNTRLAAYLDRLGADMDITEIEGFDNLHDARGILARSMERAASLWKSDRAYYLVNGATSGVLAGVHAVLARAPGSVIMARNCHMSAYHALELWGRDVEYIDGEYDSKLCAYTRIEPEIVERALDKNPGAALIILTSPTYEGAISDVRGICDIAHARGASVIVDEAHGAHLGLGGGFPEGAIRAGADIVVHSLHKTLPSLTQTAILHISGARVDDALTRHALGIYQTSSPSYLMLASIDGCVNLLEQKGGELLSAWKSALDDFSKSASSARATELIKRPGGFDPSKLIFSAADAGVSGYTLMARLRDEYNIELEMATPMYALAMTGLGDTPATLGALGDALANLNTALEKGAPIERPLRAPTPKLAMSAKRALTLNNISVPPESAAGRIAAEYAWAYPPGIPFIVPGEIIDTDIISALWAGERAGARIRTTTGQYPRALSVIE